MASIELYINKQLCEIENPETFSIYLKRQFLNPAELSTKDAQKSYDITLPATAINNAIFGYTNTEEVRGKFSQLYDAQLLVGGVKIFDGKFRLSSITRKSYKGNLGVPAPKTVKDIFGETMMNQAGKWEINNFKGFESISEYNNTEDSQVIFPLVLYGLLSKSPKENGEYTAKDIYDSSVTLGLEDFFPSVNCIEMLKKIFEQAGYNLSGTALADERLSKLYVSYKNPNEYEFDWGVSKMALSGEWRHNDRYMENRYSLNEDRMQYALNLFNSRNNKIEIKSNESGKISIKDGKTSVIIPRTGLYKITLKCNLAMQNEGNEISSIGGVGVTRGTLNDVPVEIHLVRNLVKDLSEINYNNRFSRNNIDQDINDEKAIFPQPHRVNFIDPKQDSNFLCGFSFGRHEDENYRSPLNGDNCNPMAIKGGISWDYDDGSSVNRLYSAVYSPGYQKKSGVNLKDYIVDLKNADTITNRLNYTEATGEVRQMVWLEKGEELSLLTTTPYISKYLHIHLLREFIYEYKINYELEIEPFNHYLGWLKMDTYGSSTDAMDWNRNDDGAFIENQIDLIKSLPSSVKVNDWIDNFCKAFNLTLYNTGGNSFSLDLKNKEAVKNMSMVIDLDEKSNVNRSFNEPLNIPYMYELGFTIDTNEEGYYQTITDFNREEEPILSSGDNGGGTFETGSQGTEKITQTSNFSYCWYKKIYKSEEDKESDKIFIEIPVIADREAWLSDYDYKEMLSRHYFDKGQRFWYKSGVKDLDLGQGKRAAVALVSNEYKEQKLNYRNEADTIMSNYFLLLTNQKFYTVIECYLTPEEYNNLGVSLVRFNGDIYNVAEIDGYDPMSRKKGTLKLIKLI